MGSQMCKDQGMDNDLSMDPLSSQFVQTSPAIISHQLDDIIQKIKKVRQIIDPRNNFTLKWYQSKRYGFKLYGQIKWRRPVGDCFFYFPPQPNQNGYIRQKSNQNDKLTFQDNKKRKSPIVITSKINNHYQFSSNTLIVYNNKSYYIGQIQAKKYQIPRASGKGLLVTSQFIYDGQFQDGYPEGYGRYRTKFLQFTGTLKHGLPYGDCIEKSSKGMFIGRIDDKIKIGFLITPQNKRVEINQKIEGNQIRLDKINY